VGIVRGAEGELPPGEFLVIFLTMTTLPIMRDSYARFAGWLSPMRSSLVAKRFRLRSLPKQFGVVGLASEWRDSRAPPMR
jgi:hypothetical protein